MTSKFQYNTARDDCVKKIKHAAPASNGIFMKVNKMELFLNKTSNEYPVSCRRLGSLIACEPCKLNSKLIICSRVQWLSSCNKLS